MNPQPRFQYHFEPKKGWMNDPNGLVWFKGYYHAFFQHNPYAVHWDRMHWGHATSTDLVHWEEQPIALFPDQPYEDEGGCYSGSALVHHDTLYLFYTSVSKALGQTQSVAMSSDGVHFTKYEGNPVIDHWPQEGSREFRDPMVFANEPCGGFSMVVGSDHDGHGRVLMYHSEDLLHWAFSGILYESEDYHTTIECPNFFPLGDRYVLMYSCMDFATYSTRFVVGDFDGRTFTPDHTCTPEAGPQFYAPQTFRAPDARRILIGWFFDWKRKVPADATWAGALTIPRELSLVDGNVYTYPVHEAQSLLHRASRASKSECGCADFQVSSRADTNFQASSRADTNFQASSRAGANFQVSSCASANFNICKFNEAGQLILPGTSAGDLLCPIEASQIKSVEYLEDGEGKGIEVFVNHGQWAASLLH